MIDRPTLTPASEDTAMTASIPAAPMLIETLDPDLTVRMTSRRGLFTRAAGTLGALASAPTVLAVASTEVFAQGLPGQVVDVLRFALTPGVPGGGVLPHGVGHAPLDPGTL